MKIAKKLLAALFAVLPLLSLGLMAASATAQPYSNSVNRPRIDGFT